MTDFLIIAGMALMYFVLLGFAGFCHFLIGDKNNDKKGAVKRSKSDK